MTSSISMNWSSKWWQLYQRQLINSRLKLRGETWTDEWKLVKFISSCCSACKHSQKQVIPILEKQSTSLLLPPVDVSGPAHCPAPTNQRRGGCSVFKCGLGGRRDRLVTSWLWKTFNDQISWISNIRGVFWRCSCQWRPGWRDRGTKCLRVTMKASWRRGRSKIRYLRRDGWDLQRTSVPTRRQGMLPGSLASLDYRIDNWL